MSELIDERVKAVFFDHDDTLVGTIGPKWAQHKFVAKKHYGKKLSDDELREHWGKPLRELLGLLYGTDDIDEALKNAYTYLEDFEKELFNATLPTLRHIKAAGKLIGIVTSTSRHSFEHDLDIHKVTEDLLDFTQTADDTPYHKPDPRVFEPALTWLANKDVAPDRVVYIGDGLRDMEAAVGAGFNFLGVETGLVTAEQFRAAGTISIPSIADLKYSGRTAS
jgi:phosphoglycolate phosphatase